MDNATGMVLVCLIILVLFSCGEPDLIDGIVYWLSDGGLQIQ